MPANQDGGTCYFTPVNEPSFFAWAGGEVGRFAPHCNGRGTELKIVLARAGIAGINAIRAALPGARIVNVDPLCNVVPPAQSDGSAGGSVSLSITSRSLSPGICFAGRMLPGAGRKPGALGYRRSKLLLDQSVGVGREGVPLVDDDPRRLPLSRLMRRVWKRYGGDFLITETAHVDEHASRLAAICGRRMRKTAR